MSQIADRVAEMDRARAGRPSHCDEILRLIDGVLAAIEADKNDGGDIRGSKPEAVAERGACPAEDPCHPSPPSPYSWAWEAWT